MNDGEAALCWRLFNVTWIPIGAMAALVAVTVASGRFTIGVGSFGVMAGVGALLAVAAYREAARGEAADQRRLFLPGAAAQAVFVTIIVGPLSYIAAAVGSGFPFQDHALAAIDTVLHFDPRSAILFVNERPWLSTLLDFGYGMIKWPLLGVPIILVMAGRLLRLQHYTLALSLALVVTIAISVFAPAFGNYHELGLAAADVPRVDIHMVTGSEQDIVAVRNCSLRHLELLALVGLVTFPSFHAASAFLFAWALYPVRLVGPVAVALNALMIASTPVIGGHYLIDVIAGMVVAALSILAATRLSSLLSARAPMRAARPADRDLPQPASAGP